MFSVLIILVILNLVSDCFGAPPLGFLPNIIFFYADDMGWGDLESFGHPSSLTPNLNQLQREGTKLTAFYSGSPTCSASRSCLLTGRTQTRSGVWPGVFSPGSVGGLPLSEITIASFLKDLNYSSAIIGKWHLGVAGENCTYCPANHGFDFWTGIPYSHDMPNPPLCFPNNHQCFPDTPPDPWNNSCPDSISIYDTNNNINAHALNDNNDYPEEVIFAQSNRKITGPEYADFYRVQPFDYEQERHCAGIGNKRISDDLCFELKATDYTPLPLYRNTDIIQQPVDMTQVPEYYTNNAKAFIFENTALKKPFFLYYAFHHTHHPQFSSSMFFNSSQRGMFGDSMREMDHHIGAVMDYIKLLNIADNTFVFFASDNGPCLLREARGGSAGYFKCGKGTTYEGGMRIPGIAWMPKYIQSGRVTRGIGSTLDILPTVAELVDKALPTDRYYDGISMFDWIFRQSKSDRSIFYYWPEPLKNTTMCPPEWWTQSLHAVRVNEWKLNWMTQGSHSGNTYYDHDCRSNHTQTMLDTPILTNLYHDPEERYPVNTTDPYYASIVKSVNSTIEHILNSKGLWAESEMLKGMANVMEPCCNWGCSPWPSCCACNAAEALSEMTTAFWDNK